MKIAVYLDDVSNAIDNAMQRAIMSKLGPKLKNVDLQVIDPIKVGKDIAIKQLLQQEYDVLLTYNRTGIDLKVKRGTEECSVLSMINRKHIAWLCEHPLTFFDQYKHSQNNRHYIFTNESHTFFSQNMGLQGSYSVQMFGSQPITKITPYSKRKYDICIAAQWRGPAELNAFWANATGKSRQFFEDVLYLQDTIDNRDTYTAFLAAAKHHGLSDQQVANAAPAMRIIYWYARKKERINLVKDLAKSGLKVALVGGDTWKSVLPQHKNIHFAPPVRHDDLKHWYLNSKVVATMNNSNGANERVFDAMAAGAALFSENAPNLIDLIGSDSANYYEPNRAAEQVEELKNRLNSGKAEEMALQNHQQFLNQHTWQHRGEFLNNVIREITVPVTA
ncbi:MAG: hypothetical protein RLZZ596_1897 [Pseudomonadota bacterium]|jgi:hypothetical protein